MPLDPMPPNTDADPIPVPSVRVSSVTCGFCDCALALNGEPKRLSAKAIAFRDSDLVIADLKRALASEQAARTNAESARDEAQAVIAKAAQTAPGLFD